MALKNKHETSPLIACGKDEVFFPNINLKILIAHFLCIYLENVAVTFYIFTHRNKSMNNFILKVYSIFYNITQTQYQIIMNISTMSYFNCSDENLHSEYTSHRMRKYCNNKFF